MRVQSEKTFGLVGFTDVTSVLQDQSEDPLPGWTGQL